MAVLGLTKLAAVNEIARAGGEPPFDALDSAGVDGVSEAAEIERLLETETRRVLEQEEWPDAVDFSFPLVSSGATGSQKIVAPPDTLWVRGAAPNQYKNVTLRGENVWDLNRHSDVFPDATTIYVDLCRQIPFEQLSPTLKDHIAARAGKIYQRRTIGDPNREQGLHEESIEQDVSARRYGPQSERRPMVTGPLAGRFSSHDNEPRRN